MFEKKKIEIIENSSVVSFTRKDLVDIIEPRVSEILDLILKELKKIGRQELLPCGIVLTGGGAKISKIKELTKEQLKLPVQIGKIKNILGLDEDTALATVAGLVLSSAVMDETDKEGLSGVLKGFWSKIKKMLKVLVP